MTHRLATPLLALALLSRAAASSDPHPHAAEEPPAAPETHAAPAAPPTTPEPEKHGPLRITEEERKSLLRIGDAKLAAGDAAAALIAYRQAAAAAADRPEAAPALLGMARAYRLGGDGVKAAATYEHLVRNHAGFAELPMALLELGRTLRELGTPSLAIARFYSVIHSTLKLPEAEAERYRRIVRTAQFEIAETHLSTGNYPEAVRFFNRLDLLDLAPADRARARFKSAQARVFSGEKTAAIAALASFIAAEPAAEESPEARHLLATLLAETGRKDDSVRVTLELLQYEQAKGSENKNWRIWQRRTGNQLANQFYQNGEFTSALLLYRALDLLDTTPEWRLPVLYQVALCQERLEQPAAAVATYEQLRTLAGDTPAPALAEIVRMAGWRADQISWVSRTRAEVVNLRPSANL